VAPGFADLSFRREQTQPGTLAFKSAQEQSYDADTYDFYVTERAFDTTAARTWTIAHELAENTGYTIVLTEAGGEVVPVVIEYPAAPTNDAQIVALHAAEGTPALDLYVVAPGVGIAGATPRGTFGPQAQIAPLTLPSGEYEIWLTAAGNPASVVLASGTVALAAGVTTGLIVTSEGGEGTEPLSVLLLGASVAVLYDRDATAELRVINGASDGAPRDVALNGQFSPPLFAAVPAGAPTAHVTVPVAGSQPLQVTPAGNPGVLELDQVLSTVPSQRSTLLFAGDPGTFAHVLVPDDGRRFQREAKLRFFNAATQFSDTFVDFVIVPPGADPSLYAPSTALTPPGASASLSLPPGDHDIWLRRTNTTTYLSGPTTITVAAGGIYSILAVNGPDTATANLVLFDDFP
jgi:hypothetical protein